MLLELSTEEAQELTDVLTNALASLRNEFDHTDNRAYRRGLRADATRLDAVVQRLAALRTAAPTPPRAAAETPGAPSAEQKARGARRSQ